METADSKDNDRVGDNRAIPADSGASVSRTRDEVEDWFVNYLVSQLNISPDRVDVTVPFDDFALDSATAIVMTGDLEEWLGKRVDPTLVYDYPTIAKLADHLSQL